MYAIYAYIGVVLGVNVGIYGSPMECLGIINATSDCRANSCLGPPWCTISQFGSGSKKGNQHPLHHSGTLIDSHPRGCGLQSAD